MLFENNGHPSSKRNLIVAYSLSYLLTSPISSYKSTTDNSVCSFYHASSIEPTTNSTNTDNHRPKTMFPDMPIYPGAAFIATALGVHGYRKGSLSQSGAIAAFFVGYGHLANPVKLFGVTMIGMYLIGSRATKVCHSILPLAGIESLMTRNPDQSRRESET